MKVSQYFTNIGQAISTSLTGLRLTLSHIFKARKKSTNFDVSSPEYFKDAENGIITLEYPHFTLPVPQIGRYKLHNEIDDCIVCDKCAKVCPVNCIDIEPIKSTEDIGYASDGSLKRIYAAKFDIDMAKCCFCGLCTSVCPTECLVMTSEYDFIETDLSKMNVPFANMSETEIAEKKKLLEDKQAATQSGKASAVAPEASTVSSEAETPKPKPAFKPVFKKPS